MCAFSLYVDSEAHRRRKQTKQLYFTNLIEKWAHHDLSLVDFDQRYSAYPTPTYPRDSVSVAKNSKDVTGKTKSARNFIYTYINTLRQMHFAIKHHQCCKRTIKAAKSKVPGNSSTDKSTLIT